MRLIDADAILDGKVSNAYISRFEIDNAPTIDAAEIVHGKWIHAYTNITSFGPIATYKCSECNQEITMHDDNYCLNCGAKMDLR